MFAAWLWATATLAWPTCAWLRLSWAPPSRQFAWPFLLRKPEVAGANQSQTLTYVRRVSSWLGIASVAWPLGFAFPIGLAPRPRLKTRVDEVHTE